jgi:heterodisulfide reductase subunit A
MSTRKEHIAVIGGGPAGLEGANQLVSLGMDVTLIEKTDRLGGHLNQWSHLFPTRRPAGEVRDYLLANLDPSVNLLMNTGVRKVEHSEEDFILHTGAHKPIRAAAVLIATGFDLFEAWRKEEYGYGIYDNVITSADLEERFLSGADILTFQGKQPARIGFVHCVGSRDEKAGNLYCSRICCVTAVKQAIELSERIPGTELFCFYMDLRMFGMGFEELYKEAQEKHGIHFIRGRLSEAFENMDGSVVLKVEDTLASKPLRINVDLLVLMAGMTPSRGTSEMASLFGLEQEESRFLHPQDFHLHPNRTHTPGIFVAGTCTSPKSIEDTVTDARSAALTIREYISQKKKFTAPSNPDKDD